MTTSRDPGPDDGPAARRAAVLNAGVHGLRFAFGTLSVLPVPVSRWDRPTARLGMLAAPLVGLVVGLCGAALGGVLLVLGAEPLLAAVASVAVPAGLTRGLHLDGLADTADGLGSGKPPAEALRIMRRSDIGPFGVVALVLVLLAQVAALAGLYADSWARGAVALAAAAAIGRAALAPASRPSVPPARPEGLGAAVAGTVPPLEGAAAAGVTPTAAAGAAWACFGPYAAIHALLAGAAALAASEALLRRCTTRLGGITGDVFGALVETAATTALVVAALG